MTFQTPTPQFTQLINNNLTYFQQQVDEQADDFLSAERQNIHRAIFTGLQVVETAANATDLLLALAPFLERWGAWPKWLPLWQSAVANNNDVSKQGAVQIQLAFFLRMNGDYEASALLLQDVLAYLDSNEHEVSFAKAHFHLGHSLFYLKRYDEARHHAQIAFTMFEHTPSISSGGTAPAHNLLGLINLYTGNAEPAVQQFQEAHSGWLQSGHPEDALSGLLNEALAYESNQQFDEAMTCYQRAIPYVEEWDSILPKARVYLNMGTLFLSQEKRIASRNAYLQIDRNALYQQGHIDPYTRLITNLGHVSMELGSLETAVSYLQEAISLWRQLEDEVMLANALDSLGDTYSRLEQPTAARDCYQEGLSLAQQYPNDYIAQHLKMTFFQKLSDL